MVEQSIDTVRQNAPLVHAGGHRPPQIVQPPLRDADRLFVAAFAFKNPENLAAPPEQERPASTGLDLCEQVEARDQWHVEQQTILGPLAGSRQMPLAKSTSARVMPATSSRR